MPCLAVQHFTGHSERTPMTIKGLLFDKDGTLLDFQASWGAWAADLVDWLAKADVQLAADLASALKVDRAARSVMPGSVIIAGTPADIADTVKEMFPDELPIELSLRILDYSRHVVPVPVCDLPALFDELLQMGLHLGVATNDGQSLAHAQVATLGLSTKVGFVAGYDSGFGAKPGPGMCRAFLNANGLDPAQAAMVGDSLHDLEAGRAAGMVCVAVETGLARAAELSGHADVVLPDISHLPRWLAELG
jgi:phosphoglycolate phosphatase